MDTPHSGQTFLIEPSCVWYMVGPHDPAVVIAAGDGVTVQTLPMIHP